MSIAVDEIIDLNFLFRLGQRKEEATLGRLEALFRLLPEKQQSFLDYAAGAIQFRIAMLLLPEVPPNSSFNVRLEIVRSYLDSLGLRGPGASEDQLEKIVSLLNNLDAAKHAKKMSWADLHYKTQLELLAGQNQRCSTCGVEFQLGGNPKDLNRPELDHIVPFALGGNVQDNLRLICQACNISKGTDVAYFNNGKIGQNNFLSSKPPRALNYWVYERDGSACTRVNCLNTSRTHRLLVTQIRAVGRNVFDNLTTVCEVCAHT